VRIPSATAIVAGVCLLGLSALADVPRLTMWVTPRVGMTPLLVHVRAELRGELPPEWWCPEVYWLNPNGTSSTHSESCDEGEDPPRVWRHDTVIDTNDPDVPPSETQWIEIQLWRGDKLLIRRQVAVQVLGGPA